jgi:phytoene/squalene synthetase
VPAAGHLFPFVPGLQELQRRGHHVHVRTGEKLLGTAREAGLDGGELLELLDGLEAQTEAALACGYSTNLVVHAFAHTAREAGIDIRLTRPFFASMRRDLDPEPITAEEVGAYIHGSAEVVGLMCLAVFLIGEPADAARRGRLEDGAAHLGAAFQKINFLRDFATDWHELGRNYFPWVDPDVFTEDDKARILDDIDRDLEIAGRSIRELPRRARAAVAAAHGVFSQLARRCRHTPAERLMATRIRVPDGEKLAIAVRSAITSGGMRR